MNIKKHIPNTITLGNLFCGCLAIINAMNGKLDLAAYFVGVALILDFLDGFFARLLYVSSPIGKDLDSLADMVTFGVVPGIVSYKMLSYITAGNLTEVMSADSSEGAFGQLSMIAGNFLKTAFVANANNFESYSSNWNYVALIIPIFSCLRLAKFNNDTRQSDSFIGLPTPANAMFICSIPLIAHMYPSYLEKFPLLLNPYFFCSLIIIFSFLLLAELPLLALKFKKFSWKGNEIKYIFLVLCLALILSLKLIALPSIIVLYILISIVNNIFLKPKV